MNIILVRHGQTEWNDQNIFRGRTDISLDKIGIQQAYATANKLFAFNIKAVYSSPLKRALETAEIIAIRLNTNVIVDKDLIDFDFGKWQGLPLREVQKQFPQLYGQWLNEPHLAEIPGGETLDDVRKRAAKILFETLTKQKDDVVIVSHRIVNKIIICAVLSLGNSYFWQIKQDVRAISVLDYYKGIFILSLLNDTCHLSPINGSIDF